MKRKASRAAPYERPTKLSKRSTTTTVSRKLSTLRRSSSTAATSSSSSSVRKPMAPPKWASIKKSRKAPPPPVHHVPSPPSAVPAALPMPKWPTLVPTSKTAARKKGPAAASAHAAAVEDVREVSEEPSVSVPPGLRRMSTLPLAEEEEEKEKKKKKAENTEELFSRKGSTLTRKSTGGKSALMKTASSLKVAATLEKKGSVVMLDTSGSVTTVSRLPSGSSIGETTSLSAAAPAIRKELSAKAARAGKSAPVASAKKLSSVRRVTGDDYTAEEPPTSLSSRSSSSSKPAAAVTAAGGSRTPGGSFKKAASFVPSPSTATTSAVPQTLALPLPPGGLIEIAFSFDTTGSMSSCIAEVRGRVGDMIQRLQADIPGIRISVIAHGDYCDERTYVIKWIDFGASLPELTDFVQTIGPTGGGDADECYELVLARAQTELSWTPGSQRSLVMIGDANPHPPSYYVARDEKLDWKEEAQKLADMGVRIYAVQALNRSESTNFYRTLARVTRGLHLKLDQFNNIFDIIMAVCYNEKGVEFVQAYEEEVRAREGGVTLHKDLEGVFSAFKGGKAGTSLVALPTLGKGATKLPAKGAALKRKAVALAKDKAAATTTAKRKPAKAGATPKSKATAAKVKTKASKAKAKAVEVTKAAKAGGKGGKGVKGSKPAKTTGKKKTVAVTTNKAKVKAAAKKARGKGVKAVKGRKPAKTKAKKTAASTSKAKKSKKPAPGVKRKFREAVKDEELSVGSCLRKIQWTPWYKAIIPLQPSPKGRQAWHFKRRSPSAGTGRTATSASGARPLRRSGLRHIHLLQDRRQNAPAVYEIAVKPRPSAKRYVVFFKACSSWRRNVVWDTVLLNSGGLHEEVNAVLGAGGQIWLRRGNVKDLEALVEAKNHISKCYDYAWQYRRRGRGGLGARGHRRVKRCSTLISGNS